MEIPHHLLVIQRIRRTVLLEWVPSSGAPEELIARLGLKSQQVQRYEATEYRLASLERVTRVARVLLDEAHQMLSNIYNWFTEGLNAKDLQEAKALLDQLAEDLARFSF